MKKLLFNNVDLIFLTPTFVTKQLRPHKRKNLKLKHITVVPHVTLTPLMFFPCHMLMWPQQKECLGNYCNLCPTAKKSCLNYTDKLFPCHIKIPQTLLSSAVKHGLSTLATLRYSNSGMSSKEYPAYPFQALYARWTW